MGTTAYGGKESKGRAANGDGPIGAASCRREQHTMATYQPPPPPHKHSIWWRHNCQQSMEPPHFVVSVIPNLNHVAISRYRIYEDPRWWIIQAPPPPPLVDWGDYVQPGRRSGASIVG